LINRYYRIKVVQSYPIVYETDSGRLGRDREKKKSEINVQEAVSTQTKKHDPYMPRS